jgi:hypothetical protein
MIIRTALSAAVLLAAMPAAAQTVYNTELQNLNSATVTTITDATGTRTTATAGSNSGTPTTGSWYQENVRTGGTVGITTDYARSGNGSALFQTTSGTSKGDLSYNLGGLVSLSSFSSISFDFYRDSASTTGAGFAPVFRLGMFKDSHNGNGPTYAGLLVFEYYYQNQSNPATDSWITQSSTLDNGIWWATNSALGPTFAAANGGQKSLQSWIDANAGSDLYVYGYNMGVGSGWSGTFSGAIDNVAVTNANGTSAFNFEVASGLGAVPEPSAWALLILGFGAIGGAMRRRVRSGVTARGTMRFAR